jgi:myo-inositol-1(or 4)-monophosphatase
VTQAFPDHHFLGEEDVPPGAAEAAAAIDAGLSKADWVWIGSSLLILVYSKPAFTSLLLRPFDIPLVTTCIALCWRGEVAMGVIYDPNRDEMFVARWERFLLV